VDITVAGLLVEGENDIMQPLAAVVCVKGLDADGEVAYWSRATGGLSRTEAIGMTMGLLDDLRESRRQS
jgi:hypothetical protein